MFETRAHRFALREILILAVAAIGAILFLWHEVLYFRGPIETTDVPLASYIVVTIILYLALRSIVLVADMRTPRTHAELVRCPECGQWLDDPTPAGEKAHHRLAITPKPTEKEVLAAVALRRAVDVARAATRRLEEFDGRGAMIAKAAVENPTNGDLIRALEDPDALERLLHSPTPPFEPKDDPRIRH